MSSVLEDDRVVLDEVSEKYKVVHLACFQCMVEKIDTSAVCGHDLRDRTGPNPDEDREVCIVCRDRELVFLYYQKHSTHNYEGK